MSIPADRFIIQIFERRYENEVIDFILSIQRREFGVAITAAEQPDLRAIPDFYQKGKGNFWLAIGEQKVVGTVALLDIGDDQVALRKMFVQKNFRGKEKGTARALLDTLLSWAREKRIQQIFLGTTPKYLAAHRFYEKNDFLEIDRDKLPKRFPIMKVDTKFYRRTV
jgi:N-acetylglutamate synthase-like GNAT family acetyltransferase